MIHENPSTGDKWLVPLNRAHQTFVNTVSFWVEDCLVEVHLPTRKMEKIYFEEGGRYALERMHPETKAIFTAMADSVRKSLGEKK